MSKSTGSFLDWLLSRRRMRMRAQQEEPIKAKQQGVEVKPVSTEGFLTRLLEKRGAMEAPQKPVVKKEVEPLNIKEQNL